MKSKFFVILLYFLVLVLLLCFEILRSSTLALESNNKIASVFNPIEKRAFPPYDAVFDKYRIPHFRVFFWVPKSAKELTPYADPGINTKVLNHGSVENWSVVKTNTYKDNEQLVFIYVPKSFVIFYGKGFENVIHLNYK
ncbi:hypothetical protein N3C_0284 [Clostridium sp. N3C]|uniref:hypothetical protein n=1 Tax=Clostridium sp. N3C TaxID=1776758 RepID=UPI00092E1D38|nr:hypothetical protein [Clostridium sp. N3C]SCN21508.1 hypothetical protein N3C_0284 [Clostridium sp. N3C]